jgi:hypothetical protein
MDHVKRLLIPLKARFDQLNIVGWNNKKNQSKESCKVKNSNKINVVFDRKKIARIKV